MRKIRHVFLSGILLVGALHQSYAQNLSWAKNMGGEQNDACYDVGIDAKGNVYSTGYYQGPAAFDPSTAAYNLTSIYNAEAEYYYGDIFVSKLDPSGNYIYAKSFGTENGESASKIDVTRQGEVYFAGGFVNAIDFDPSRPGQFKIDAVPISPPYNTMNPNVYICKLDTSGTMIWVKALRGNATCELYGMTIDTFGNIYTTGRFYDGSIDFDPGPNVVNKETTHPWGAIFISKLDSAGNFVWAKMIEGRSQGNDVTLDPKGNVYATGYFRGTMDFDPGNGVFEMSTRGAGSTPPSDAYVLKLANNGDFIWAKQLGGLKADIGTSIVADTAGNVYTIGTFADTADFDPGNGVQNAVSNGFDDVFISKLDASGNFKWVKTIGGSSYDGTLEAAGDVFGAVYISGLAQEGTMDLDPGPGEDTMTVVIDNDMYILKLDSDGNYVWATRTRGGGYEFGRGIRVDNIGGVYVGGDFHGTVDFDPSSTTAHLTPDGAYDIFVMKLKQCVTTFESMAPNACDSFHFNNKTFLQSGTYTEILSNSGGCDSVVTLFLSVGSADTSVTQNGAVLTSSETGAIYQWVNCGNGYTPVNGATSQSFTPSASGDYAVVVSKNGCTDTSGCHSVIPTGISELSGATDVTVYPNPTSGHISVSIGQHLTNASVRVVNISGQTMMLQQVNGADFSFDVTNYPAGFYSILISNEHEIMRKVFVKK